MSSRASARWRMVARAFGLAPALTVTHKLHPEHELSLVEDRSNSPAYRLPHLTLKLETSGFRCDVCKRWGQGSQHYRCEPCNFDAHMECATAPARFEHVNYSGGFVLCDDHVPQLGGCRYCAVCGRESLGYRYYNSERDIRLHPCCAVMPRSVDQDGRTFLLGYFPNYMCGMCGKKSLPWLSYWSTYDDGCSVYLHVRCLVDANDKATGYQDWVASAPIRPGVMGSFTRKKEENEILKAAKLSCNIVRIATRLVTFDIEGVVDVAHKVVKGFKELE